MLVLRRSARDGGSQQSLGLGGLTRNHSGEGVDGKCARPAKEVSRRFARDHGSVIVHFSFALGSSHGVSFGP